MTGLVPAIHVLVAVKTWMPGTRPGMTSLATGFHFIGGFFHRLLFEAASRHLADAFYRVWPLFD
jgi:hypothetical protein